jgi:hypothetical protein
MKLFREFKAGDGALHSLDRVYARRAGRFPPSEAYSTAI